MTTRRSTSAITPRLMPAPLAASYLGISETKLRSLAIPRKALDGKRVYEKADLDDYADRLPYEGETGGNSCDQFFGGIG